MEHLNLRFGIWGSITILLLPKVYTKDFIKQIKLNMQYMEVFKLFQYPMEVEKKYP